jgi:hypothetical protein
VCPEKGISNSNDMRRKASYVVTPLLQLVFSSNLFGADMKENQQILYQQIVIAVTRMTSQVLDTPTGQFPEKQERE